MIFSSDLKFLPPPPPFFKGGKWNFNYFPWVGAAEPEKLKGWKHGAGASLLKMKAGTFPINFFKFYLFYI